MASGDSRAARRYTKALFQLALQRNEVDEIARGVDAIAALESESPQLMTVLQHPQILPGRKKELLVHIFGDTATADLMRFLNLLIDKKRMGVLPHVPALYKELLDQYRHEADAEAITAVPMTYSQEEALKAQLRVTTGYTVRLTTRVDESILGGMIVRIGDVLIDGSARTQLQALREQFLRAKLN